MSEELRDSLGRLRITAETDAWLEAESRATGNSKHDIAREALHQRALLENTKATYLRNLWPREGSTGKGEGSA